MMDDANDDTHLCLRCKKTIVGLENYIIHRRQLCMCLVPSANEVSTLSSSLGTEHRENPYIVHLSADHFFSSLELQSKTTVTKNSFSEASENQKISTFTDSSLLSDQIINKNDQSSCKISNVEIDFHFDVSNSSEDYQYDFYPPRSHTGGKWKPGTRPDIENRRQWDVHSCPPSPIDEIDSCEEMAFETKTEKSKNEKQDGIGSELENKESFSKEINEKRKNKINVTKNGITKKKAENTQKECKCEPCNKTFENKMKLMIHLLTSEHQNKFDDVYQWHNAVFCHQENFIYTSLFQCLICRYFFNNNNAFTAHLRTSYHVQNVAQLKEPLLCLSCQFECQGSDNLLKHVLSKEHQKRIRCVSDYHPVVIKEKINDCCYCLNNCQLQDDKTKVENCTVNKYKKNQNASNIIENYQVQMPVPVLEESEFSNSQLLKCDTEKELKCTECNSCFPSLVKLNKHLNRFHSKEQPQSETQISLRKTKINKKYKKQDSEFETTKVVKVKSVEKTKYNNKKQTNKKFLCPYCSKPYPKHQLRFHIFTHTGEKPFKCYICSKGFTQRSNLQVHIKRHLGLKRFKCDKCDFRTVRKSVLLRHQETHKSNRTRNCLCDVCGSPQLDQWALKQHMKIHSKGNHKCTHSGCHLTFRSPSELLYHLRVHTNERPYLCDICGYCGKTAHQLKKHQRSHTGERPFKCKHCSYSATLSSHLLRHMRLHTGSKPYKCPYCPYACNTQENIRKHILKTKKHAGKKMYPCKFCDFACNDFHDYREHLVKQHSDHFPNGEKQIDSSVIAGVYVKDFPRQVDQIVPYSRKKSLEIPKKKKKIKNKIQMLTDAKISEIESHKDSSQKINTINNQDGNNEHTESVVYIEIPPSNLPSNTSSESIFKDICNEPDMGAQISIDNVVNHTVSESYTYPDDGTSTQVLISGDLDCFHNDEMSSLIDPSVLHLTNVTDNNTENTIFIYVPFT